MPKRANEVLLPQAQSIRRLAKKDYILRQWLANLARSKIKTMHHENLAKSMARRNTLRWILQQWDEAIQAIRRERMEEQNIADKWKLVDEWLKEQSKQQ